MGSIAMQEHLTPPPRWSLPGSRSAFCDSELVSSYLGPLIADSFPERCLTMGKDAQARPLWEGPSLTKTDGPGNHL